MGFTVDEVGIANLFIMTRGRSGPTEIEDRNVLIAILREVALQGVMIGLRRSQEIFRESSDAKGGCKMLSSGEDCNCFLCKIDNQLSIKEAK